jgi:hypothetical protein
MFPCDTEHFFSFGADATHSQQRGGGGGVGLRQQHPNRPISLPISCTNAPNHGLKL